jgi:hypothetical protein
MHDVFVDALLRKTPQQITATIISDAKRPAEIQFDTLEVSIEVVIERSKCLAAANHVTKCSLGREARNNQLGVICPGHVLVPDICPLSCLDMPICPDTMQAVTAQVTCLELSTTNLFLARDRER